MKKISIILTLGLVFYITHLDIVANDNDSPISYQDDDEDDDWGFNNSDLTFSPTILDQERRPAVRLTNAQKWSLALNSLTAEQQAIFNESIYKYTSAIKDRSILDFPFTLTYGFDLQEKSALSVNLFFNAGFRNFTQDSIYLSSYLNTEDENLINILEEILATNPSDDAINIGETLQLFSPGKIPELRAGGIIEGHIVRNKWYFNLQLPVQYIFRALYYNQEEKNAIFNSDMMKDVESSDNETENQIVTDHFIMDQFGLGDLRLKAMYQIHESPHFDIFFGGFITLPTAKAFKQGIVGTWFPQDNSGRAYLDLNTIDPENVTQQNLDDVSNFFLAALDKLNSNILHSHLGNNGHVIPAISCNTDWYFAENWKWSGDYSFELPLRANEQRFYKAIQSSNQYSAAFTNADNAGPEALVLFINQELQNMFFPYVFSTSVFPGVIINSTNQVVYTRHHWTMQLGSNFWYQGAERITPSVDPTNYNINVVATESASQGKLFGRYNYNFDGEKKSWSLSGYADITVWNSGIGNDFTLGLCLDCKF